MDLRRDLEAIGVARGTTVVVHSSLSKIGWVDGGAPTVVQTLLAALGEDGTLAMPAATPQCLDSDVDIFDIEATPTKMGAIAEAFRTWPRTRRSLHPLESVCARGPNAEAITRSHPLAFSESREGPFGRLYDLNSQVLLLGVGFNRCTALHLAESMVPNRRTTMTRFQVLDNGAPKWVEVPNVADDNGTHFPIVGKRYVDADRATRGTIGEADSFFFPMKDLVDFAARYFAAEL